MLGEKMENKININDLLLEELEEYIEKIGEKKFHAKQIYKWLHKIGVTSFDEMTDISKSLREKLKASAYILNMDIIEAQVSKKDGTMKFLIKSSIVEMHVLCLFEFIKFMSLRSSFTSKNCLAIIVLLILQ